MLIVNAFMYSVQKDQAAAVKSLNRVLNHVLTNKHSSYYRSRFETYGVDTKPISELGEWRKFPLLEREHMTVVPIWERTFMPLQEVDTVRYTGGTSGRYLCTPRRIVEDYGRAPDLVGVKRQATMLYGTFLSELSRRKNGANLINIPYPGNPEEYKVVTQMVKLFKADSLCGLPWCLVALASHLKAAGIIQNIKSLELCGERCSDLQRKALEELYGNPIIFQNYSLTEVSGVFGTICPAIIKDREVSFHLSTHNIFSEFIDPDTLEAADPREVPAELVVSSLDDSQPFPLIRYRTGDLFKVVSETCSCQEATPRFEMVGRAVYDRIRFMNGAGGFHLTLLDEALKDFADDIWPEFEAHFYEQKKDDDVEIRGQLEVRVVPREAAELDYPKISEVLSEKLMISSSQVYQDAVKEGWLLPLRVCKLTEPTRNASFKRRYLFHHV